MKLCVRLAAGVVLMAVLGLVGLPGPAAGQELDMTVLNEGKAPPATIQVSAIINGGKQPIARTDADGRATLPFDLLNLGKGTRVTVTLITCEGETEVVLVPEGEPDEECDRAREDPDCDCEVLGVIFWGETTSVTIDVTSTGGTMTAGGEAGRPAGPGEASVVRVGFKVDAAFWPRIEDAVCGQSGIGSCEADESSIALLPFIEARLGSLPLAVGVGGFYSTLSFVQEFSDPQAPSRVEGDLDVWGIDFYGRAFLPLAGRFSPWLVAGGSWLRNEGVFVSMFPAEATTEERDENGIRVLGGGGFDWVLAPPLGIRVNVNYRGGGGDDADQHIAVGAGLILGIF